MNNEGLPSGGDDRMDSEQLETLPISRSEFSRLDVFQKVSFESLAGYLLACQTFTADIGTVVIDPAHFERRLIIVLEGALEARSVNSNGLVYSTIGVGQCAGEMSVFDNVQPSARVVAKEKSRLLIIPANVAMAMLNASHDLCLNFLHILSNRVRNNSNMVVEERFHIRCIEENSKVDILTGLHNRRWLEEMFTREISRCNAGNYPLAALMIDIDKFKDVNDTYGHLSGDQVLVMGAQVIADNMRPTDMPVRYGGEEFSIFLPDATIENARLVGERLRKGIENATIQLDSGEQIHVTVSIGVAERFAGDSVQSIIERSDKALYYAKQNGRNRICLNVGDDSLYLV